MANLFSWDPVESGELYLPPENSIVEWGTGTYADTDNPTLTEVENATGWQQILGEINRTGGNFGASSFSQSGRYVDRDVIASMISTIDSIRVMQQRTAFSWTTLVNPLPALRQTMAEIREALSWDRTRLYLVYGVVGSSSGTIRGGPNSTYVPLTPLSYLTVGGADTVVTTGQQKSGSNFTTFEILANFNTSSTGTGGGAADLRVAFTSLPSENILVYHDSTDTGTPGTTDYRNFSTLIVTITPSDFALDNGLYIATKSLGSITAEDRRKFLLATENDVNSVAPTGTETYNMTVGWNGTAYDRFREAYIDVF